MRTQDQNPAYARFKHLLPPSGLYPARWVDIFSNTDDDGRFEDVEVVFIPRGADGVELGLQFWDEFANYNARWLGDLGNSVAGWMEPDGLNPEKVFGTMLFYGFSDRKTLLVTVDEFAAIEECEWARQMKAGRFPEILQNATRDRKAVAAALHHQAGHQWSKDMLGAIEYEANF